MIWWFMDGNMRLLNIDLLIGKRPLKNKFIDAGMWMCDSKKYKQTKNMCIDTISKS